MIDEVTVAMHMATAPPILASKHPPPAAWTHPRAIVLTEKLGLHVEAAATSTDAELKAILCHELHHWRRGDAVASLFVWAAAWSIVLAYNLTVWLSSQRRLGIVAVAAMLVLWPAWVLINLLIIPVMTRRGRLQEYEADAAAVTAGYGAGLHAALSRLAQFEAGRTGWEQALVQTHPPTELRLEQITRQIGAMAR